MKKPLNLSASAKFVDGSKQDIFLGRVTLTFTYELLGQTAPDAKTFAKQTASDTLVISLAS